MRCGERERLESALNDASNRQEELANHKLAKIRSGEPDHARFDSKIATATERVNRAQQSLQAHKDGHGCS